MRSEPNKRLLSHTFVRGLKPAAPGQRAHYWDTDVRGFGVRVTDRGAKSFVLYARVPPSRMPARLALGDADKMGLAAARKKAREWLDQIQQGRDPRESARQEQLAAQRSRRTTFAVVAEAWLEEAVQGQRKAREVAADVRREFIPRWGNRPVTEVTSLDVRNAIVEVKKRAPAQARNVLGYAKRLFGGVVAQHAYGLEEAPAERLRAKDLLGKKVLRQRVLTDAELRALWREIDFARRLWTIPAERMKGGAAHVVPMTDAVIALLETLPRFKKGDHLFSTTYGAKPVNGFSKAKGRLDAAMTEQLGGPADSFVIHDIRRT